MCFATPEQVVELGPGFAVIQRSGERVPILLHLLDEPVAIGDWLAVQAQRHAVARLTPAEAQELSDLYRGLVGATKRGKGQGAGGRVRVTAGPCAGVGPLPPAP